MDETRLVGLGIYLEENLVENFNTYQFCESVSLLDYNCALFDVDCIIHEYIRKPDKYSGLDLIGDDNQSARLISDMNRRKDEVTEMLERGDNIFVIMPSEQHIYVRTGKKEYSGTGANARVTNIVALFDLLSFLPIEIESMKASGDNITFVGNPPFDVFWNSTRDNMGYLSYITKCDGKVVMKITNTKKSVSMVIQYLKGKIILLPALAREDWYDDDRKFELATKICVNAIKELDKSLKSSMLNYKLPTWCESIYVPDEKEATNKLNEIEQKIRELEEQLTKQKAVVNEIKSLKLTFTATGKILEEICEKIFLQLGFVPLDTEENRTDLALKYKQQHIVIEIKGLTKSAGEKNAAQLEKWVSEHITKYGVRPKAILLVNGYKDIALSLRNEDVFPNQMINYACSREQCLLTTTQLLCLYIDCRKNPRKKAAIIKDLLQTIGIYNKYIDFGEYLNNKEDDS